jgi:hypothetical protein
VQVENKPVALLPPSPSFSEASTVSEASAASDGQRSKAQVKSLLRRGILQPRLPPTVQFVPLNVEAQSVPSVLKPVPKAPKQVMVQARGGAVAECIPLLCQSAGVPGVPGNLSFLLCLSGLSW